MENNGKQQIANISSSFVYLALYFTIYYFVNNGFRNIIEIDGFNIWLFTGILYLVFGKFIFEKYFTTPLNVAANTITIILALMLDPNKDIPFWMVLSYTIIMLILTLVVLLFGRKDSIIKDYSYKIITHFGSSKVLFSIVFIVYCIKEVGLQDKPVLFVLCILLWAEIIVFSLVNKLICELLSLNPYKKEKPINSIASISKKESNYIYSCKVEDEQLNVGDLVALNTCAKVFNIGVVFSKNRELDGYKCLIQIDNDGNNSIDYKESELFNKKIKNDIFRASNGIYLLGNNKLNPSYIKLQKINDENDYVGYITKNSNIHSIEFVVMHSSKNAIFEGKIVKVKINTVDVLFQVINANTQDVDCGYIIAEAHKIGRYKADTHEIQNVKWLPDMYTPVYIYSNELNPDEIAPLENSIGRLPQTNCMIDLSNIDELITHNTAILGVLGIGKSRLTFELIQKIIKKNIKVLCIDITNQYYSKDGLLTYINDAQITCDNPITVDTINNSSTTKGASNVASAWGNETLYKNKISKTIMDFFDNDHQYVYVMNPDLYNVTRAASTFNVAETIDLSLVEKSRIISEAVLKYAKSKGQSDVAKYAIVYEEAHSIIPEWNSIVQKGDDSHSNGISKVILQGRKYGLGCIAITQRTANISKSILNQCNTIFALRCYDDTAKNFLSNYFGSAYSTLLPSLEERTAISIGKGINCKQPIILQLNDMKHFIFNS